MRKHVLIAVLSVTMLLVAGAAQAAPGVKSQRIAARATGGNVPSSMLAEMGLAEMEVLSDQQGTDVRGSGFFFFFGGFTPFFHHHHHPFFFSPHAFFFHHHHHGHGHFHFPFVW
jgi:hypothetical protein